VLLVLLVHVCERVFKPNAPSHQMSSPQEKIQEADCTNAEKDQWGVQAPVLTIEIPASIEHKATAEVQPVSKITEDEKRRQKLQALNEMKNAQRPRLTVKNPQKIGILYVPTSTEDLLRQQCT